MADPATPQDTTPPAPLLGRECDPMTEPPADPVRVTVDKRPSYATYTDFVKVDDSPEVKRPGLYYHGIRHPRGDGDPEPFDLRISSPITCEASTCDERGDNFGLLLRFRTAHGQWREWALPLRLLKGSGEELRGELLDMGVRIDPDSYKLLNRWLASREPVWSLTAATRAGWHQTREGRAFVMPRRTIGSDHIIFQSESATNDEFTQAGTLAEWQATIGRLCQGNPLLVLAISTALVGPLLDLAHRKGAGLHFVGDSSSGKTTLLEVAASVWGGPTFLRTWRATGNGLEGIAAALSDTVLVLDEIGEADARDIGATIYALGNGTGKARASRNGRARTPHRWRIALLSSGERTLAAHMAEAKQKPKSGQAVRLLDIPVQQQHGAFDFLHGFPDGRAFSDHLKAEVQRLHGQLGPAFIKALLSDSDDIGALLDDAARLPEFTSENGIEGRAAKTLALIGVAGEKAIEYGLVPWGEAEAMTAAMRAFKAWRRAQGGQYTEHQQILENVRAFLDRHGDARFSDIEGDPAYVKVHDRAGWWRDDATGSRTYLLTTQGLNEAIGSFDPRRGLNALEAAAWLAEREEGHRSIRLRVQGRRQRLYAVRPAEEESSQ